MDVREDNKTTEVGLIPLDWAVESIKDFASITTGGSDTQDKVENGAFPFYVRSSKIERINKYSFDGEAILTSGDGVGVGKIFHYVNDKFDFHQRVYSIYNLKHYVNGKYIFYQFSTNFYDRVMSMTAKSSVDSVRREMIADMKIPLPPLPEQQAIAEVLSDTDNLIQALEKQIAKKRLIKQGVMQELLRPKEGWMKHRLGDIFQVTRGYVLPLKSIRSTSDTQYSYPVFSSQTKDNGLMGFYKEYIYENSITWTTDGANAGDVKFRSGKFYCTNVCGVLISSGGYANSFVAEAFNSVSKGYVSYVGNPKLMNNVVKQIEIMLPSLREQMNFSEIIEDLINEIDLLDKELVKIRQIKNGIMQQLLTGKIRLNQKT